VHYYVDVVEVDYYSSAGSGYPEGFVEGCGVGLSEGEMGWESISPFTELAVQIH
jgi:hypothetical protein